MPPITPLNNILNTLTLDQLRAVLAIVEAKIKTKEAEQAEQAAEQAYEA